MALVVGVLTLIDPTLTGLTGATEPQIAGPEVFLQVIPEAPATLESPTGDVSVEIPAGGLDQPVEFYYARIEMDTAPALPDGYVQTDRVFDLSTLDEAGERVEALVEFNLPIEMRVDLVAQDVALAGGDASLIVIQHYHPDEGWEVLPTEAVFATATATSLVERLSIFALTIKEPEEVEEEAQAQPVATVPPTSTPTPRLSPPRRMRWCGPMPPPGHRPKKAPRSPTKRISADPSEECRCFTNWRLHPGGRRKKRHLKK